MPRLSSSRRTAEQGLLSSPGLVRPPWPALSFSLLLLLQLPPTGRETLTWKKIEVMSFLVYFPLASGSGKELPSLCVCGGGGEADVGICACCPSSRHSPPSLAQSHQPHLLGALGNSILSQRYLPGLLPGLCWRVLTWCLWLPVCLLGQLSLCSPGQAPGTLHLREECPCPPHQSTAHPRSYQPSGQPMASSHFGINYEF